MSFNPLSTALSGMHISNSQLLDSSGNANSAVATSGAPSFASTLQNAFDNVNGLQNQAAQAATSFATGQVNDVHSVMIAAQKATIALDMTTQVRNQIVSAYQQVMQMQM